MATKNIQPITCYIKESILLKYKSDKLLKAKIISIQAYKNFDLSFQILIEDKYLYSNISIYDLILNKDLTSFKHIVDLPYIKCPDYSIDVYTIDYFIGRNITYFINGVHFNGVYLASIDFYEDNEQLHLIKSNFNTLVFVPNHKIIFNDEPNMVLPNFKKL